MHMPSLTPPMRLLEVDTPNGQHFCTIFDLASLP